MNGVIKDQIVAIRDSGETNMFDIRAVFEIALREDYYELADFIFMNTSAYSRFILTGEEDGKDVAENNKTKGGSTL
jgi:hypothetical protein